MKIEIATERSVLVECSAAELQAWNLTYETLEGKNTRAIAALQVVLARIQAQTGRSFPQRELEIDLLPSLDGGCLLILTDPDKEASDVGQAIACVFESADALLDFLSFAEGSKAGTGGAELYRNGGQYLLLWNKGGVRQSALGEFGAVHTLTPPSLAYLREHWSKSEVFGRTGTQL